jgi:hypothetical protein
LDPANLFFDLLVALLLLPPQAFFAESAVALVGPFVLVVVVHQLLPQGPPFVFQPRVLLGSLRVPQLLLSDLPQSLLIATDFALIVFEPANEVLLCFLLIFALAELRFGRSCFQSRLSGLFLLGLAQGSGGFVHILSILILFIQYFLL